MTEKIINEYKNGKSILQLSKEYPISYGEIQRILTNNHITIRGGRKKVEFSEEQLQQLQEQLKEGKTYNEIAEFFRVSKDTVRRITTEHGYIKNNKRVNKRIDSNYFSNIDAPEKAYWLGLLFTDGSVDTYDNHRRIRLQLKKSDSYILEKLKDSLKLDCKMIADNRPGKETYSIEFVDKQIFDDLGKYNIIPQKTYKVDHIPYDKIPNEFLSHYARGLFDGDGSLSCSANFSTDVTFNFTSYYESTVTDFRFIINNLINKEKENSVFFSNAWHTQWRGRLQVLDILDKIYENNNGFYIPRKYDLYQNLKNSLK